MLFESAHVRVSTEYGTATLWLDFPGEPVNALDLARLREIHAALSAVERHPFIRILVVRSAKQAGFCAGIYPGALASLTTGADRAAFAWAGQRVFDRLANLGAVTVAYLDGPCLGAGLELALACDHRLCLSRPGTHLGFPDAPHGILPGFGGTPRLRQLLGRRLADRLTASGRTLSGREAMRLGLVGHAFCERRGENELRTFLDRLERSARQPRRDRELAGLAEERREFARSLGTVAAQERVTEQLAGLRPDPLIPEPLNPIPPFPPVIGLLGEDDDSSRIAADVALRGGKVVVCGSGRGVHAGIAVALARGFVTPLEAEQAKGRVKVSGSLAGFDRAGLVLAAEGEPLDDLADAIRPRCAVAVVPPFAPAIRHDADALAALAAWLRPFGIKPAIPTPARARDPVAA